MRNDELNGVLREIGDQSRSRCNCVALLKSFRLLSYHALMCEASVVLNSDIEWDCASKA